MTLYTNNDDLSQNHVYDEEFISQLEDMEVINKNWEIGPTENEENTIDEDANYPIEVIEDSDEEIIQYPVSELNSEFDETIQTDLSQILDLGVLESFHVKNEDEVDAKSCDALEKYENMNPNSPEYLQEDYTEDEDMECPNGDIISHDPEYTEVLDNPSEEMECLENMEYLPDDEDANYPIEVIEDSSDDEIIQYPISELNADESGDYDETIQTDLAQLLNLDILESTAYVENEGAKPCDAIENDEEKDFEENSIENAIEGPPKMQVRKEPKIKCSHCDQVFTEVDFKNHICEFDKNKLRIKLGDTSSIFAEIDAMEALEPDCVRLIRENQAVLRRFIKDDLKFDLDEAIDEKEYDQHHMCTVCGRKFVHASGLARHSINHVNDVIAMPLEKQHFKNVNSPKIVIKCTICCRVFFETQDASAHLFEDHFHKEPILEEIVDLQLTQEACSLYEANLMKAISLYNKLLVTPNSIFIKKPYLVCLILNNVLQCEFCDILFIDVTNLFNHSQYHNPATGFQCYACKVKVPILKDIQNHFQNECVFVREKMNKNLMLPTFFVCNVCEQKFISVENLQRHRYEKYHFFPRLNGNDLQISCELCGEEFGVITDLLNHNKNEHQKKSKKQENSHKFRQFLCEICGKSYTQSSHLWQHLRFHKGIKPFICKVPECQRRFTIRPDLDDHTRKCHTGERPYHCLVCGKRFLTGSVFYQHRLIHRNERRYGCEECGKRFYRADALKNHNRIHTGEKPYSCIYCLKSFRQQGDRDKHIRARHPNSEANAIILMQMKSLQERGVSIPVDVLKGLRT